MQNERGIAVTQNGPPACRVSPGCVKGKLSRNCHRGTDWFAPGDHNSPARALPALLTISGSFLSLDSDNLSPSQTDNLHPNFRFPIFTVSGFLFSMLTALAYKKSLRRAFVFKKLTALGSFSTLGTERHGAIGTVCRPPSPLNWNLSGDTVFPRSHTRSSLLTVYP